MRSNTLTRVSNNPGAVQYRGVIRLKSLYLVTQVVSVMGKFAAVLRSTLSEAVPRVVPHETPASGRLT